MENTVAFNQPDFLNFDLQTVSRPKTTVRAMYKKQVLKVTPDLVNVVARTKQQCT